VYGRKNMPQFPYSKSSLIPSCCNGQCASVVPGDEILFGHQINKILKSFVPCYSRFLLLADIKEIKKSYSSLVLKSLQKIHQTRNFEAINEWHFVEWHKRG
jgi:hypothetical protein